MKINLVNTSRTQIAPFFVKLMQEWSTKFAIEHNIKDQDARHYILDDMGKEYFCNFLIKNQVLNISPYKLSRSDGTDVASGFDIVEDQLYTFALLKYSEGNNA